MDPNEALKRAREAARILDNDRCVSRKAREELAVELDAMTDLAEAFDALDQWISKGGFLPDAWQVPAHADFPPPKELPDQEANAPWEVSREGDLGSYEGDS